MKLRMKVSLGICALTLVMALSACTGSNAKKTPSDENEIVTTITPKPTAVPEPTIMPQPTEVVSVTAVPESTNETQQTEPPEPDVTFAPDSYLTVDGFANRGTVFTLTDDERRLYEEYIKAYDISIFKDISAISIGKIWIECGNEGKWQGEYELFSEKGLGVTKLEYQEYHVMDTLTLDISTRRSMADIVFANFDDGVFEETEDGLGEITFLEFNGNEKKMHFVKNKDGIWTIKFNPFDPWEEENTEE